MWIGGRDVGVDELTWLNASEAGRAELPLSSTR
jgi:hypothetical protein